MKNKENLERLERVRQALGFSQREMAEELGVVHGAVGLWESGKRKIPGPVLKLIALYEMELGLVTENDEGGLDEIESNWLARMVKVCNTGAVVTGQFVMKELKTLLTVGDSNPIRNRAQIAIAQQIADTFGRLKGVPHKLGQLISYMGWHESDEARELYATLQSVTPPMRASLVTDVMIEEFSQTPNQLFAEWNPVPFAAASIGQVHRAKTKAGQDVAVKVQYPNIREVIESDLKNATIIDRLGTMVIRHHETGDLLGELTERFLDECDYRLEAKNQMHMRLLHQRRTDIIIPEVMDTLSSGRVITMEYIEGLSFQSFCKKATQDEKNRAGSIIWDFAFESVLKHGTFNGDPHPGNYLFIDDKVAFIDYGCVKRLSKPVVTLWKQFARSVMEGDIAAMREAIIEMGTVREPDKFDYDTFYQMMRDWYYPFYCNEPFTITRPFVAGLWQDLRSKYAKLGKARIPKDHLFLNQLQWGLYSVLAELNATANWTERITPLIDDKKTIIS